MKKIVSLLLAALLLCMLIPAMAEATDVTGEWILSEMLMGDSSIVPSALGMSMTITLNEDGTAAAAASYGGENVETTGSWTMEGTDVTITMEGDPQVFAFDGETLKAESAEGTMVFTRDGGATSESNVPAEILAESDADFQGTWELTAVGIGGQLIGKEVFGVEASISYDGAITTMVTDGETYASPAEFVDGQLVITDPDGTQTIAKLNDNGWLSVTYTQDAMTIDMYFAKAE